MIDILVAQRVMDAPEPPTSSASLLGHRIIPKGVVFRTKRTFSNFELCHTQKGERSLPVFRIIAGVPKNAIAVGADRTRDSLAATIRCAMFCVRDVEFALVTTFVAMRLVPI